MSTSAGKIVEVDRLLRAGKLVPVGGSAMDKALVVAIARRIRGAGADRSDPHGPEAMMAVEGVLADA